MSLNTNISNCGISANTELSCKSLIANQLFLSGSSNSSSIAGGLTVENGIVVGASAIQGAVSSFTGKDLFVGSGATCYVSGGAEVRIRGAGDASVASFTIARQESVVPIVIQDNATCYLQLPKLTTAQRDALTAVVGMMIYNSTTGAFNAYDGAWKAVTLV
jgi:hypothetical protein